MLIDTNSWPSYVAGKPRQLVLIRSRREESEARLYLRRMAVLAASCKAASQPIGRSDGAWYSRRKAFLGHDVDHCGLLRRLFLCRPSKGLRDINLGRTRYDAETKGAGSSERWSVLL